MNAVGDPFDRQVLKGQLLALRPVNGLRCVIDIRYFAEIVLDGCRSTFVRGRFGCDGGLCGALRVSWLVGMAYSLPPCFRPPLLQAVQGCLAHATLSSGAHNRT